MSSDTDYAILQRQRRERGGAGTVATSTLGRLASAQSQADAIAEEEREPRDAGTTVPPIGGSAQPGTKAVGDAAAPAPPPPPSTVVVAPKRRPTHSQGTTFLLEDFEKLTDVVHALRRNHQIRNPLGAKFGPSHVAGALVHHLLPMWEENPEGFASIVRAFLADWAGGPETEVHPPT